MKKQQGASLLLTLIVLVAMIFSTMALMKSTSTASMVSGNLAFRDAAMHAADIGMAEAIRTVNPCGSPAVQPCGKASDASYVLDSMQPVSYFFDKNSWTLVTAKKVTTGSAGSNPTYEVKYIVDRLSTGAINMQDSASVKQHSLGLLASDQTPSNNYNSIAGGMNAQNNLINNVSVTNPRNQYKELLSVPAVFYRITVRVTGPSNTEVMSQTSLTVAN